MTCQRCDGRLEIDMASGEDSVVMLVPCPCTRPALASITLTMMAGTLDRMRAAWMADNEFRRGKPALEQDRSFQDYLLSKLLVATGM